MKRFFAVICAISLLFLCACTPDEANTTATENATQPVTEPVIDTIPSTAAATEPEATSALVEATESSPDYLYTTPYYTLTMPGNWQDDCFFEFYEFESGTYNLAVYEAQGYQDWKIGYLFSILLYEPTQDYTIFSNYQLLGTIESPDWEYNVVALFPSEVQFSEDTAEVYGKLYSQVSDILQTFTPTDACHYYPGREAAAHDVYETLYYTLNFPKSWGGACFREVILNDDFTYNLVLYEAQSYEAFGGGKLCSILLMHADDKTYQDFPSYELLAVLDTPEGKFNVVVLFPTDVQFTEDTADAYNALNDQLTDVLYSIKPRQNIEMIMP